MMQGGFPMSGSKRKLSGLFAVFFVLMVLTVVVLETILYNSTAKHMREQMANKCVGIATAVAVLLEQEPEALEQYIETLDTGSDYYIRTKANIEKIRFGNQENLAFLYVERRVSGTEMQYLFDGEPAGSETFAPPGSIEPLTPTRQTCYETGQPCIGDFVTSVWGTLLSGYAPVYNPQTGQLLAIVGADVSVEQYDIIMGDMLLTIVINILVLVLIAAAILLFSSNRLEKWLLQDGLTGIYNRGFFLDSLKAHLKAIKRNEYPVVVFMADIDHFKTVNDTYGHPFGDKVLANVSSTMNALMRKSDCLARYGGEEFSAIMPGLSLDKAQEVVSRIHAAVGRTVTRDEAAGTELCVTISIGVAAMTQYASVDQVIQNADIALYQAKKTRNTVVFWDETMRMDAGPAPRGKNKGPGR